MCAPSTSRSGVAARSAGAPQGIRMAITGAKSKKKGLVTQADVRPFAGISSGSVKCCVARFFTEAEDGLVTAVGSGTEKFH